MRYRPRRPLKDRVLAEWRGYWEPQDVSKYEQEIESVVGKAMKGLGLKDRFNEEQVFEAWNEMVDNFIGSNARPVVLEKKVLSIQVLHSTVHYELERMKGQLLRRMQERFGAGLRAGALSDTSRAERDALTAGRVHGWTLLAPEVLESPWIGRGLGSTQWSAAVAAGLYRANHPHNIYLEVLSPCRRWRSRG